MAAAGELRPFEVILFDGGSTLFYFAGNPVEVLRQGVKDCSWLSRVGWRSLAAR